jgi:UDP-N-acetyl-D-glucosamine dehydrogenase
MIYNKIGIIGIGYVGLPLAVVFAEAGYQVLGFDVSDIVCKKINNGESHIKDISSDRLYPLVKKGLLHVTSDFRKLTECQSISICVPTPLNKIKEPDLSYVISATKKIAENLIKDQLIILESTTYPGTTRDIMLPILEKNGLKVGKDFNLCFSPERVDPGNTQWNTKNTPKILGGITDICKNKGLELYNKVFDKIIPVQNTEAAELVKVYENTFRMINIALANELSQVCDKLGLDVWDLIEAANTKPFGFMKFLPGPGLGGHCIPLDPHYLAWKMRTLSFTTKMIDVASQINSEMPKYVVEKIQEQLNKVGKALSNSKVFILGVAYKKDIDDLRESPALDVINILQENNATIIYHDPFCPVIKDDGHTQLKNLPLFSQELNKENLSKSDIIVIITDHSSVDYALIREYGKVFVDTRGILNEKYSKKI